MASFRRKFKKLSNPYWGVFGDFHQIYLKFPKFAANKDNVIELNTSPLPKEGKRR